MNCASTSAKICFAKYAPMEKCSPRKLIVKRLSRKVKISAVSAGRSLKTPGILDPPDSL